MPTGYTAELHKRDVSFNEFVWTCARAFGALIDVKDEPFGPATPAPLKPHRDFHDKGIAEALAKLSAIAEMSDREAEEKAAAENVTALAQWEESERESAIVRARYEGMIARANAWTPPTLDHKGLKEFMLQQLRLCESDYKSRPAPKPVTGADWLRDQQKSAEWALDYHRKQLGEELVRTRDRNSWIGALNKSVPAVDVADSAPGVGP